MMDTRGVRSVKTFTVVAALLAGACACWPQALRTWDAAVRRAAQERPDARIVVLDIGSGHLLAASHLKEAARTLAAPGSTLKPLVLYGLIEANRWDPSRRIACTRKLTIAGRVLDCTHPAADPMDAREALTWSCNTYFATVGGRLAPGELRGLLAPTGLLSETGLVSGEARALLREPQSADQNRLTLLGVDGILVTPLELAMAYRWLALQLANHADTAAASVVEAGLTDSAAFGMAGQASLGGVAVAGKTGTAVATEGGRTHGWFIGLAPQNKPSAVIAIFIHDGRGADAAHLAGEVLAGSPLGRTRP
ncbi:MAG: penicillin-binding transpeptidase domain-containing protein [Terracidiphilus sp.]|jgi:peptidoglycan glycosyltransferase